jgi:hypothetical protein
VADRREQPGEIVERAIEVLRELPPVDSGTVERIVAAAARTRAQDSTPNEDDLLPAGRPKPTRRYRFAVIAAAAIVVAATGLALLRVPSSGARRSADAADASPSVPRSVVSPASLSRDDRSDVLAIPTQFVFDGHARRVALVGDFNNWDDRATPLEREPGSSLWSVTVPMQRGRHIYAFLVDSVWTVDKRAPVPRDPDFGVTGSVILVGRP